MKASSMLSHSVRSSAISVQFFVLLRCLWISSAQRLLSLPRFHLPWPGFHIVESIAQSIQWCRRPYDADFQCIASPTTKTLIPSPSGDAGKLAICGARQSDEGSRRSSDPQRLYTHKPPTCGHTLVVSQSLPQSWANGSAALRTGFRAKGYGSQPNQQILPTCCSEQGNKPKTLREMPDYSN